MNNHPNYFGYIRVSTSKQGEQGVSLQEQKDAILRFASRQGLQIAHWFEERVTAAARGRPVFTEMLRLLKNGKARGVIVHKIDRSARNLGDWAQLGDLIDQGIEVRFANDDLDLRTRGGRLSADIQAVIASDYVRNLREETKKGLYGRLKQGVYPFAAPIGYLDQGAGRAKAVDPIAAPLIRQAFEWYAAGIETLRSLVPKLTDLGLRTRTGSPMSVNGASKMLRNPFYFGLIRIKVNGETFRGAHAPIITKSLFDRVQERLDGKKRTRGWKHDFLFRRLLKCLHCGMTLIGELQKGHRYYRCHNQACPATCVREDVIAEGFRATLRSVELSKEENQYLREKLHRLQDNWQASSQEQLDGLTLHVAKLNGNLNRLTDAYLDGTIDRETFLRRKESLHQELVQLEARRDDHQRHATSVPNRLEDFLELVSTASLLYETADTAQRRSLLELMTSNRRVDRKNVTFTLPRALSIVAERQRVTSGGPHRGTPRTLDAIFADLVKYLSQHDSFMENWSLTPISKSLKSPKS